MLKITGQRISPRENVCLVITAMWRRFFAVANLTLLDQVVEHKRIFFPSGWAHYDTAKPGSMKLAPDAQAEKRLRSDYESMREMFFGEVEDFDAVIATIRNLQAFLNSNSNKDSLASFWSKTRCLRPRRGFQPRSRPNFSVGSSDAGPWALRRRRHQRSAAASTLSISAEMRRISSTSFSNRRLFSSHSR